MNEDAYQSGLVEDAAECRRSMTPSDTLKLPIQSLSSTRFARKNSRLLAGNTVECRRRHIDTQCMKSEYRFCRT